VGRRSRLLFAGYYFIFVLSFFCFGEEYRLRKEGSMILAAVSGGGREAVVE
jgi:hypothetical protein